MEQKPFGLFELGSTSLKFYLVKLGESEKEMIETRKFPWNLAHEFFSAGRISE